jgi:hypothetical protein
LDPDHIYFEKISDPTRNIYDDNFLRALKWLSKQQISLLGSKSSSVSGAGFESSSYGTGSDKKFRILADPIPDADPQYWRKC